MLKPCWIFLILLIAYLCDIFCVTASMQIFLSAIAVFYLAIQSGALTLVPFACILGLALDVNFAGTSYFYTFFLPTIPILTANYWQRQGDCSNLLMQLLPVTFLSFISAIARIITSNFEINSFKQFSFVAIYTFLSLILTSTLGIIFIASADELAEKIGFTLFANSHKKLRG